jgi:PST family polysaccharide transporter
VSALCLALSGPLVNTVYGHRWSETAPILGVLGVFGSVRVMLILLSHLLTAVGWTRQMFVLQVIWLGTLVPSLIIGVYLDGAVGAAWAQVVVVALVVIPVYLVVLRRLLGIPLDLFLRSTGPPLMASVAAGIAAYALACQIRTPWLALILGAIAGLLTYGLALNGWLTRLVRQLRRLYGRSAGPDTSAVDVFWITRGRHRAAQRRRAPRLMSRSRNHA